VELRSKRLQSKGGFDDGLSQALSLVVGPVLFAVIGAVLDQVFGTGNLLLVVFGLFGFAGSVTALYYRYQAKIAADEKDKPWNRRQW
jgi:F0F1-type ATP synthase assembly protein I